MTAPEAHPATTSAKPELSLFHRVFDKMFPGIRYVYERILGHAWFTQITPQLWLGGAPYYKRDYEVLVANGINAVVDVRAERQAEIKFYDRHDIRHVKFHVPDVTAPNKETLTQAVDWITEQVDAGRVVLVHCAKGRGRSATILAGYLMREEGMTFDEAFAMMKRKRPLTKLEDRHRRVLEAWLAEQTADGQAAPDSSRIESGAKTPDQFPA